MNIVEKHRFVDNWLERMGKPLLRQVMLTGAMKNFIVKHKAIFMEAIIAYAEILPDYREHAIILKNTETLIEAKDKFLREHDITGRKELIDSACTITIDEYEHDPHYAYFTDYMMKECKDKWVFEDNLEIPPGWFKET